MRAFSTDGEPSASRSRMRASLWRRSAESGARRSWEAMESSSSFSRTASSASRPSRNRSCSARRCAVMSMPTERTYSTSPSAVSIAVFDHAIQTRRPALVSQKFS